MSERQGDTAQFRSDLDRHITGQRDLYQPSIQDAFTDWMAENKPLVAAILKFSMEARLAHRRYGIAAVVERARWHFSVERGGYSDFKINNNFRSRLARWLMENHKELDGLFETRKLKRD